MLATAQDQEHKDLQLLRDSLVGQRLKLLKRISFADDHIQSKNTSVLTLSVPNQLVVKGRGKELITMVDTFIRKTGARFKIIKFYVHRVGHDYALQLGVRVRWNVGRRIIMILSGIHRFGSQYTLGLEKFKDTVSNADDSAQHMLDMLAEVETTTKSLNLLNFR